VKSDRARALVYERRQAALRLSAEDRAGVAAEIGRRAVDITVALVLLTLLSPLLILIAVAIPLESRGPVIFRDERFGRHGRRFVLYKFRTMRWQDPSTIRRDLLGETSAHADYRKPQRHQALTTIGAWLRRFSLDELPNFVNVLRGDMTMVGPRPTGWASESYGEALETVLSVKPGVTGLWQVLGRGDLTFSERVALDLRYVRERSIRLDLWILIRTIPTVLGGRGAY
jgi:exopolysaccharide production protein ExoY